MRYSRTEVESPVSPVAYSLENDDDMVTATTSVTAITSQSSNSKVSS